MRRVLAMKAMLGLFEDPFRRIDEKRETARSMLPQTRALAREAGRKSIVLLKNDGDLLPLPRSGKKIALIGPFASGQHDLVGPWVVYGDDAKAVDLATGVRAALADKNSVDRRRGLEGRRADRGRHRAGGRGGAAGRHRRARHRRNAGHVGRGPVAHRNRRSGAAAGRSPKRSLRPASRWSWC